MCGPNATCDSNDALHPRTFSARWFSRLVQSLLALRFVALATVLLSAAPAAAQITRSTPWPASTPAKPTGELPHPSVARVIVPNRDGTSFGSGTLVEVDDQHGLVITNWHVVNEASGTIRVVFPDGFESAGSVLGVDRDWDLAAIAIWKPRATPVPFASQPPQPGDPLTIAGYGSGNYRSASGRCTQYLAPGKNFPNQIVEVNVAARHGDSGGPMFNQRGEIAGVLFGAGGGCTTGSYCGRARMFLATLDGAFQSPAGEMVAQAPPPTVPPAGVPVPAALTATPSTTTPRGNLAAIPAETMTAPQPPITPSPRAVAATQPAAPISINSSSPPRIVVAPPIASATDQTGDFGSWEDLAGRSPIERVKFGLSVIGMLTLAAQILKLLQTQPAKAK